MNKYFEKLCTLLGLSLLQSGILLLIVYIMERLNIFGIYVKYFDHTLIYPYELGGFFFILILITSFIIEIVKILMKRIKK